MNKMDSATLLAIIRSHRDDSLGVEDGQLSNERAKALDHYHGRPYGNEVEGRSQVVDRSLAEAVDWVLPGIMKVFTQSGRLAEFDPVGPEDEQLAAQESDYVNQVLMKDNNGFMVLHDAIKDTLLLKNGYAKHWWEEEENIEECEYSGLTLDAITMLLQQLEQDGAKVEVVGQESRSVPLMQPAPMPMNPVMGAMPQQTIEVFDIRVKVTKQCGKLIWMAVPTEEVRVSKKCRGSLQESPFTEHVTRKTRSDLIEMGMDRAFVDSLAAHAESSNSTQKLARDSTTDESDELSQAIADKSMDEIEFCEAYLKVDFDGDGVAELRKVVTCAGELPPGEDWNEPIPAVPLTGFVAKRVPHRHVGESLDDELADLQEIMTVLKRQLLDNIYRINNAEMAINEDANLRDFMTSTPGGIKRIKGSQPVQNAFSAIMTTPIIDKLMPVIDYIEGSKEQRTGISKATTGMDPDVLQQTTKGAYMENLSRASQKVEMIIRLLAETGVKESVLQSHALLIRHQDQPRVVQMRGKWVSVNPQEWQNRTDLSVRVGLGTGSEEDKRGRQQLMAALQTALFQALINMPPEVYDKAYAMFSDMAKTLGEENPEKYAIAPGSPEHQAILQQKQQAAQQGQPGADDISKAAQIQAQAARDKAMLQDQFARDKAMLQAQMDARDREADRRHEMLLEQMRMQSDQAKAAMVEEVKLMIAGMRVDLGAPGISAGVQGSPGINPAAVQVQQPTPPMGGAPA